MKIRSRARRFQSLSLLFVTVHLLLSGPVFAEHSSTLGIGSCNGERTGVFPLGTVVDVEICLSKAGSPLANHPIAFLVRGRSSTHVVEANTNSEGRARTSISSTTPGTNRIGVCDSDQCFEPIVVSWSTNEAPISETLPSPPPLVSDEAGRKPLEPRLALTPYPFGLGFSCSEGSSLRPVSIPAFITIQDRNRNEGRSPSARDTISVTTGQNVLSGSAIYGEEALVFVSMLEPGTVDRRSSFPYRGFNRQLVVWTIEGVHWGKQEFVFDGDNWRETPPQFTAVISHEDVAFISDAGEFSSQAAVGTRAGGLCDGMGFESIAASPQPSGGRQASTVSLGIGLLILIAILTVAVMQATEAPPGISVESPGSSVLTYDRSSIKYDDFARPIGYVDTIRLPDGSIRTVRKFIRQEELLLEGVDFLDSTDWDDPIFEIEREGMELDEKGRVTSFTEITRLSDGTIYRADVGGITYDGRSRVASYSRTTSVSTRSGQSDPRLEVVQISHEGDGSGPVSNVDVESLLLAPRERVERRRIALDREGHVSSYVSRVRTHGDGSVSDSPAGLIFRPALAWILYESGYSWGDKPLFESRPVAGLARARRVLIRWFRRHGCRVDLSFVSSGAKPLEHIHFRFGDLPARTDHRGKQTMWALEQGRYSVSVGIEGTSGEVPEVPKIVGWVNVTHIPGTVKATMVVEPHKSLLSVED